jgi:hypothetical protein
VASSRTTHGRRREPKVDNLRYGLLRSEDVTSKGGRSNAAFPDHLNLSPAYAKATADATIAAKAREAAREAQRKEEEITSTAEFIASDIADGGHLLPKRTIIGWRETRDGPPVVETVTIWPLDPAPVVDLLAPVS